MRRLVLGAISGFCATMAMTVAMRAMHSALPRGERYPLPPREITERMGADEAGDPAAMTLLSHFAYGALAGAVYGVLRHRPSGLLYGPLVWAASYLGWIPAANVLRPATSHPAERNLLMLAAHLVWGAALSQGLRELDRAAETAFDAGRLADAPRGRRSNSRKSV